MNITKDEQLALLTAIDKRVSPALKDAKDEARADLMEAFAENGTDRKAILVGGEKVGEVGISYSKAAPFIFADRMDEAIAFLRQEGLVEESPAKGWEQSFDLIGGEVVYKPTGEVVEWAGWNPKAAKTAAVRGCKPEDVIRAFGNRLQSVDAFALIEGEVG